MSQLFGLQHRGDGEIDMFLSLLMMLKPTAESLDSGLIPAPFCKTEKRILSLSCLGRDEILSVYPTKHDMVDAGITMSSRLSCHNDCFPLQI